MYYTDSIKLTARTEKTAVRALDILRTRLSAGFDCDAEYDEAPSHAMLEAMAAEGRVVVLSSQYLPKDTEMVMCELLEYLAEGLGNRTFACEGHSFSEDDYGAIKAAYKNGVLTFESVYYPRGYCEEYYCEDCGTIVVYEEDYEVSKTYVCPDCGKVVDPSGQVPVMTKKTIQII